ncbi:MAG TPA: thioredoxin family protein [Sulfuricurvum sp.]|nr:MAG: glutaredoxin [Campylobacterales bacterium 16-40-21]OZA04134.1 MAG: glutaredoxin [Sulfuricurvum sp. 17-40-25]HQS66141.1 thioredoxin family protein [Sulfuricurvum sp.]HQT35505.1 thioredoxin family protein [Sulfuricurvum sp.]
MLNIEVFSAPGCAKCVHAKAILKQIVAEHEEDVLSWREVDIMTEMDYAIDVGVMSTPAIAINGILAFTSLPSLDKLRKELEKRIQDA